MGKGEGTGIREGGGAFMSNTNFQRSVEQSRVVTTLNVIKH